MDSITFVTYSHSDYADILPIVQQGIQCVKVPEMEKVFASDLALTQKDGYDRCIQYTDSLTYPQKICEILKSIQTEYVVLVHDIDYVEKFDTGLFQIVRGMLKRLSMDRLSFGMVPPQDTIIEEGPIRITNSNKEGITPNFCTPYDISPSIWRTECLRDAMSIVLNHTYRTIEQSEIQTYLSNKNVYAFTTSPSYHSVYQIGRPFSSVFTFIHLLTRGMWLHSRYFMDCETMYKYLLAQFTIDCSVRGILETPHLDYVCNRVV